MEPKSPEFGQILQIGYSDDQPWKTMQRPGQRNVLFGVAFEELAAAPQARDYRLCLEQLWSPLLSEAGLSACMMHQTWHPEHGPDRQVIGWVWRQHGTERLGTLSEAELMRLVELLRAPGSRVTGFVVTEQLSTEKQGGQRKQRKFKLRRGEFTVEQLSA